MGSIGILKNSLVLKVDNRNGCIMVALSMASITLKGLPEDLHGQLQKEAKANFRSLTQEVQARLQRSFEIDAAFRTKRDQVLIDEAMESGPEEPLTRAAMDKIRDSVLRRKKPSA
jgi:hypothetical protein